MDKETAVEYKAITCNEIGNCAINTGTNIINIYCSTDEEKKYCYLKSTTR